MRGVWSWEQLRRREDRWESVKAALPGGPATTLERFWRWSKGDWLISALTRFGFPGAGRGNEQSTSEREQHGDGPGPDESVDGLQ